MPHQPLNLHRRDLFRLAGAGTAAVLASGVGGAAPGAASDGLGTAAWDRVNDTDPRRSHLWEQQKMWFNNAKFGMFIHWGPVSLASVEISWPIMEPDPKAPISQDEYVNLYKRFNPVQYDPDAWVELARQAGQRYMVFVTKHHDGFCMFDSAFTDYKIANTPYKKDIVRMLGEACGRQGMPLGYYYSPPDMHHPCFRDTSKLAKENWNGEPTRPEWPVYLQYMEMQLRELLCRYHSPVVIWFDGLNHQEKYDGYQVVRMIREISPGTLVNNRIGVPGDFGTPEQFVPDRIPVEGVEIQGTDTFAAEQASYRHAPPRRPEDLGNLHDDQRHLGLQQTRHKIQVHPGAHSYFGRRCEQRRKPAAERRPYARGHDPAGVSGTFAGNRTMAGRQWRFHLRHHFWASAKSCLGPHHGQRRYGLPAHLQLARGRKIGLA